MGYNIHRWVTIYTDSTHHTQMGYNIHRWVTSDQLKHTKREDHSTK
jgi:hypothetical protein